MEKLKPKKSLGQNFLIDKNISGKIADSLDCHSDNIIVEIGCGTGALTEQLLKRKPKFLFSIDIDQRAVDAVKRMLSFTGYKNFEIIHSDIREIQIVDLVSNIKQTSQNINIIGNIPYNISGDILFWLISQRKYFNKAIIMIQKEVAERLVAKPNSKLYGITSVAMNLTCHCKKLFNVSPKCFEPVPKVTSTVVEITPFTDKYSNINFEEVMRLVKAAFNQRRKVLRNALRNYLDDRGFHLSEFDSIKETRILEMFSLRAEQLSADDFLNLCFFLNKEKNFK